MRFLSSLHKRVFFPTPSLYIVMHQQDVQFVQAPSASMHCPICPEVQVFVDPVITKLCHHTFCSVCYFQAIANTRDPTCPLCRSALSDDAIHPNLAVSAVIAELPIFCPNRASGCTEQLPLEHINQHLGHCPFQHSFCPHRAFGCSFEGSANEMSQHASTCIFAKLSHYLNQQNERILSLEEQLSKQKMELDRLRGTVPVSGTDVSETDFIPPVVSEDERPIPEQAWWSEGPLQCVSTIKSHVSGVTALVCGQETLYSGSYDGTIMIHPAWDHPTVSSTPTQSFHAHRNTVWSLAYQDGPCQGLFSGSSDKTIKVWDLSSHDPNLIQTFNEHQGKIYSMVIVHKRLFSASSDQKIKVWDISDETYPNASLSTWSGHTDNVNGLVNLENQLASVSSDRTLRLWDLTTGQDRILYTGTSTELLDVTYSASRKLLFASTYDANIICLDPRDSRLVATLSGHNWEVWQLECDDHVLLSGSFDHTIKRWDIRQFQNSATLRGHHGYVHALALRTNALYSGCADRTIKIWAGTT